MGGDVWSAASRFRRGAFQRYRTTFSSFVRSFEGGPTGFNMAFLPYVDWCWILNILLYWKRLRYKVFQISTCFSHMGDEGRFLFPSLLYSPTNFFLSLNRTKLFVRMNGNLRWETATKNCWVQGVDETGSCSRKLITCIIVRFVIYHSYVKDEE